ncbi:glycoside hydrolase [Bacteroides sp.]
MNIKKLLVTLGLCLPIGLAAQDYADYKLYAAYDFEQGTAIDKQANTNLQLGNGATIVDDAVRGKVLSFTGAEHQYAVMEPAPIVGDVLSLSFWFKRGSVDDDGPWKQIFEFHNSVDDSNIYLMPVYGYDDTKSGLVCDTKSFKQGIWEAMVGPKIGADDSWHHITVVINGTEWSYYLDGGLATKKTIFGSLSVQAPTQLYFGMNPNRGTYPMTCAIDDINIYHYPLSDSQVAQIYAGETVTEPVTDEPIAFHFDGNLDEENGRIELSGSNYTLSRDSQRGEVVKIDAGGQLNFSKSILPEGPSTINFLYKKESISSADDGKYIYQCSKDNDNSYGIRLKVDGSTAYLVLENVIDGTKKEKVGTKKLEAGNWYAISIHHAITGANKGTMRVFQNGGQSAALTQVVTYGLGFEKWSLGSTTASQSTAGIYDELNVENYAMTTNELNSFYLSNLTSVSITVDYSATHQTIRNFGASDAWNAQLIGTSWPDEKKGRLAELLFSKEFDADGNPKGIGLSCWRFNIGSGSFEQGESSKISSDAKRTECFLSSNGTYDWEKQAGQQWFLKKAVLDYGVEDVVGFMNAPPVFMTKDGYAFNKSGAWNYILAEDKYADFADFTANVVDHFEKEGIHFDYISPVNEPQYQWNAGDDGLAGQEGSPATDQEIANVVKAMSSALAAKQLTTQLFVGEAGAIASATQQVPKFWGDGAPAMKIAGLPNVSNIVSAHSYWSDDSAENMYNTRVTFKDAMQNTDPNLEFFQTEYSLLGGGYAWGHPGATSGNFKEIECAMSLARMLHVDLAVANATGWHWWTTFEQGSHGGESRFALIEALTKQDLTDGIYNDTKLLYTLGQYSRFVRPGMKRVDVSRSDELSEIDALKSQMYSAYINEDTKQVVIIATNSTTVKTTIKLAVDNLPVENGLEFTPYVTSDDEDLKVHAKINEGETFTMPPLSVVTFVSNLTDPTSLVETPTEIKLRVFPNPVVDDMTVSSQDMIEDVMVYDVYGKMVKRQPGYKEKVVNMPLSELPAGIYLITVLTENGHKTQKIVKK